METGDCTLVDREALMVSYIAGTLPPDRAEAFEAHYFGCDTCWRELEQGLEIRAAMEPSAPVMAAVPAARVAPAARHWQWGWLAAAASVVLVASLWRFAPTPGPSAEAPVVAPAVATTSTPSAPIVTPAAPTVQPARPAVPQPTRGTNESTLRSTSPKGFLPVATRMGSEIRVEWPAVEKASRYVVTIFATNGFELLRQDTSSPSIVIDAATAPFAGHADERFFAQVEAIGAADMPLAKSARVTIPARREEASR